MWVGFKDSYSEIQNLISGAKSQLIDTHALTFVETLKTMLVRFTPTNEQMDTDQATAQKGAVFGPYTPLYLSTPSGYTPVQGVISSGSPLFPIGRGGAYLYWYNQEGVRMARWKFNDSTASTTALAQMQAALAGGAPAITLAATGDAPWVAPAS
jgi:hypothetical protein